VVGVRGGCQFANTVLYASTIGSVLPGRGAGWPFQCVGPAARGPALGCQRLVQSSDERTKRPVRTIY
jgi:hypothetical protein